MALRGLPPFGGKGQGQPQLRGLRQIAEARRHHADDRVGLGVEPDGATDDRGVGAEPPPPESVAQHGDEIFSVHALLRGEGPAQGGVGAEQREKRRRDFADLDALRRTGLANDDALGAHRGGFGERGDAFPAFQIMRDRDAGVVDARLRVAVEGGDEPAGLPVGQGLEEDGVHHGKNCDIGPEAEGEDQQDREGKTPFAGEAGEGLADITQERFDEGHRM